MYVVIDRKKLTFLPIKHPDHHVIGDLVWIEAPQAHVFVTEVDHNFLKGFSDLELMLLYKNTTGQQAARVGDSMRNILTEIAERIPVREVNKFELDMQANLVPEDSKKSYLYNPGQFRPIERPGLFPLDPVTLPRAENETLIASRPRVRPPAPQVAPPATTPAPQASARPVRAAGGPRMGGIRELVWAVADKLWAAAGSPKDASVVLKLRKEMMAVLEKEHNVKKTSSSNELGSWMKARI